MFLYSRNIKQETVNKVQIKQTYTRHALELHTCMPAALLMSSWIPRPAHLPTYEQRKDAQLMALC